MYSETVETAKIGRDIRSIVTDLQGISLAGSIADGQVLSSYGFTVGGSVDPTSGGILLDAVVRENGGTAEIKEIILREMITDTDALVKPALSIYILDSYSLSIASRSAFTLSPLGVKAIRAVIDIAEADWKDIDSLNAIVHKAVNLTVVAPANSVLMKAVVVMKSTSETYTAKYSVQMELRIARD